MIITSEQLIALIARFGVAMGLLILGGVFIVLIIKGG